MVLLLFKTLKVVLIVLSAAPRARSQENETIGIENNLHKTLFKNYNRCTPVRYRLEFAYIFYLFKS